ncbi:MAG: hypothetical protein V4603_02910 [Pseudomonadota bacterium]
MRKTSCPYEILLWINIEDATFLEFLLDQQLADVPIRVLGITPGNIGMQGYKPLFDAARFGIIAQLDDDVIRISTGIGEMATDIFTRRPEVKQLVADTWQDKWTNGARYPLRDYQLYNADDGLYEGKIDGWCSLYHRSVLPVLLTLPYAKYQTIGAYAHYVIDKQGSKSLLCTRMRVLHLSGPYYASLFDRVEAEKAKFSPEVHAPMIALFEQVQAAPPPREVLALALQVAIDGIDAFVPGVTPLQADQPLH